MYDPKKDLLLTKPFIDAEEPRTRGGTPFTYVHGGFEGTNVKFMFCFPEKDKYEGRFYHFLSPAPGPDEEIASLSPKREGMTDHIVFALTHGAYFVESNMGASSNFGANSDPTILYRSSAAVAEYSREVATRLYGCSRPFGYVYGGSGGGFKTCSCIENTSAFDGAVPYVTAAPVALPNIMTVGAHAARILRNKMEWIADVTEPGSDHDVHSGLNDEEKAAFDEVTRMGFPPQSWAMYAMAAKFGMGGGGSFGLFAPQVRMIDPEYFSDFWTKAGYLGTEPDSSALRDRVKCEAVIRSIYIPEKIAKTSGIDGRNAAGNAWEKMIDSRFAGNPVIEVENLPELSYPVGINIRFLDGESAGAEAGVKAIAGNMLILSQTFLGSILEETLTKAKPGDVILLDNSDSIAIQTYHRHQVPTPDFTVWDQFRNADGTPKYPQRENQLCMGFAYNGAGSIQNGNIQCKTLMVNCIADGGATTWMADWYRCKVRENFGADVENRFRLWCMENCGHMDSDPSTDPLREPTYLGALYRALIEVAQWVEKGKEPAPNTRYTLTDGQPSVPENAMERGGVQAAVSLMANGKRRAEVKAGETVRFTSKISLPADGERIILTEWSFEGEDFTPGATEAEHVFKKPGTYFVSLRVQSNNRDDCFTAIQNIDRARVVVS